MTRDGTSADQHTTAGLEPDPVREQRGRRLYREVLGFDPAPGSLTPVSAAVRNFGFAEVWSRPGLDRRSRRWITLACVTAAGARSAMRVYAQAALESGDITLAELREFSLQLAVFQGFPKAVEFELILNELARAPSAPTPATGAECNGSESRSV